MKRAVRVLATLALGVAAVAGCASNERPVVVPGSTIATSSTTTSQPASSADDVEPSDLDAGTTTTVSRLDPSDPDYPTTSPQPRTTVSYPVVG